MRKLLVALHAAMLFGCASLSKIQDENSRKTIQSSLSFFEIQAFDSSIIYAKRINKDSKFYGIALLLEAFSQSKLGNWDSTQTKLTACSKHSKPGSIEFDIASLFLGYLAYDRKPTPDLVSAASQFIKVKKSSPLYDEALIGLGWSFVKVQRFVDAKQYFQDVIKMDVPSTFVSEAYYGSAVLNYFAKNFEEAISQCEKSLEPNTVNKRFGEILIPDSLYSRKDIQREALQVRWSVACIMDKESESTSCIRARELNRTTEPVALLEWQNGKIRIVENIDIFSRSILRKGIL